MKIVLIVFTLTLGCQTVTQQAKTPDAGTQDAQPQKQDAQPQKQDAQPQKQDAAGTNYTDDPDFVGC